MASHAVMALQAVVHHMSRGLPESGMVAQQSDLLYFYFTMQHLRALQGGWMWGGMYQGAVELVFACVGRAAGEVRRDARPRLAEARVSLHQLQLLRRRPLPVLHLGAAQHAARLSTAPGDRGLAGTCSTHVRAVRMQGAPPGRGSVYAAAGLEVRGRATAHHRAHLRTSR